MELIKYIAQFKIIKLSIEMKAIDKLFLQPFKGSAIRGTFGHAFKLVFCNTGHSECKNCHKLNECYYSYVFETPISQDAKIMKKYTNAPHPFVIIPPLTNKCIYYPGEILRFDITLIGRAIEYFPYFIAAFDKMGKFGIGKKFGKLALHSVSCIDSRGNHKNIFDTTKKCFICEPSLIEFSNEDFWPPESLKTVEINFITPVRIQHDEKIIFDLEFHCIIRSLLRRISAIYYFHICKEKMDIDFNSYIYSAEKIQTKWKYLEKTEFKRFSNRQNRHMNMDGIMGTIKYDGDITAFYPLLKLGEFINVGKGTSFGLGKYTLSIKSDNR